MSDPDITKSAGLNKRYTDESLIGVIVDIHFLSLSDHLVCTFSSQVNIPQSILLKPSNLIDLFLADISVGSTVKPHLSGHIWEPIVII